MNEPDLIRLFMELTGEPESAARSVLMYLNVLEQDHSPTVNGLSSAAYSPEDRSGSGASSSPAARTSNPGSATPGDHA